MKKLLFAASAVALAAAMSPAVIGSVQAAPAKSPYCDMAKSQKNLVAWNAYYHCLGEAPRPAHVAVRARPEPAKPRPVDLKEVVGDGHRVQALGITAAGEHRVADAIEGEVAGNRRQCLRPLAQVQHVPDLRRLA